MSDPRLKLANLILMERGTDYDRPISIATELHPRLFRWHKEEYYYLDKRIGSTYVYSL